MKDLQAFLETEPLDNIMEMSAAFESKKPPKAIIRKIFDTIASVWQAEKGLAIKEKECTDELTQKFNISLLLWVQIKIGQLELTDGRICLTNDKAKFRITKKGTDYVENKLLPTKN